MAKATGIRPKGVLMKRIKNILSGIYFVIVTLFCSFNDCRISGWYVASPPASHRALIYTIMSLVCFIDILFIVSGFVDSYVYAKTKEKQILIRAFVFHFISILGIVLFCHTFDCVLDGGFIWSFFLRFVPEWLLFSLTIFDKSKKGRSCF